MRIDFEEITPSRNKIKVIAIVILVILFIGLFALLGMYYGKLYNFSFSLKNITFLNGFIQEENAIKKENYEKNSKLPIYTKEAKEGMNNVYNKNSKIAYLTFDDGPSEVVTNLILDVLKEQNVKATFFVVGSNVNKYPEIVKRAYEEGHYIANHGYSHNYAKIYSSVQNVLEEYNKTEKVIQKAIGNSNYSSCLFRFPGGYSGGNYKNIKKQAGNLLNKNNISYIDWNVLTGDAQGANTKEAILKNVKKYSKDKGNIVVLMHDASSKILTYETLTEVINYLRSEGYTFENFFSIMR